MDGILSLCGPGIIDQKSVAGAANYPEIKHPRVLLHFTPFLCDLPVLQEKFQGILAGLSTTNQ